MNVSGWAHLTLVTNCYGAARNNLWPLLRWCRPGVHGRSSSGSTGSTGTPLLVMQTKLVCQCLFGCKKARATLGYCNRPCCRMTNPLLGCPATSTGRDPAWMGDMSVFRVGRNLLGESSRRFEIQVVPLFKKGDQRMCANSHYSATLVKFTLRY